MISLGYYIEILQSDFTCIDPKLYGILLIVDPEEEYFDAEIIKLEDDIKEHGLSLIVFADWYNVEKMKSLDFTDQNTNSLWTPQTGGANVPALNDLLGSFGIQLGDFVFKGSIRAFEKELFYAYGSSIIQFPAGGYIVIYATVCLLSNFD
jgi:membrane-bound transcription factor site-1 protease